MKFVGSTLALAMLLTSTATLAAPETRQLSAEQSAFIDTLVEQHQLNRQRLEQLLLSAEHKQDVLDAIQRPWEAKPWHQYHPIFLTEKRLNAGLAFWQEHEAALARAEAEFGVPAEVIVAIIGVETFYGTYLGKHNVLDTLYTLGFHYPPRAKFFRKELGEFFRLTAEEGLPAEELQGSYAGAMGYGQFISSSYRHYAIDFDGDGVRDLIDNPVDAIGSVANYFAKHRWQAGAPVALPLSASATNAKLASDGLKLTSTLSELKAQGLELAADSPVAPEHKAKVFAFELEQGHEYWLGLQNFYVITRYNHSPLYAMVVHQFSQQLARTKQGTTSQ